MKNKKCKRLAKRIMGECIRRNGDCFYSMENTKEGVIKTFGMCKFGAKPCWNMQFNFYDLSSIKVHGIRKIENAIQKGYHKNGLMFSNNCEKAETEVVNE